MSLKLCSCMLLVIIVWFGNFNEIVKSFYMKHSGQLMYNKLDSSVFDGCKVHTCDYAWYDLIKYD